MEQIYDMTRSDFTLKRDADGFYICPICGAPSIFFSDARMHLKEIHKGIAIRGQIWKYSDTDEFCVTRVNE